jgi:ribonuclease HI
MPLKEMSFRGARVFVEVDDQGALVLDGGRARMRYKPGDERVYSPWPANLSEPGAPSAAKPRPAQARSASLPENAIVAYTDGACSGNPGPAGLGYTITFPDGRRVARGEPLGTATNNIGELTAILRVLEHVDDPSARLVVHTDSEYAIGVLTRGWKVKANQALVARIKAAMEGRLALELRKVAGHAGVPENELADTLARAAAETQRIVEDQ